MQTAAVQQDCDPKVVLVTETAGGVDPLDLGIDGFAGRIRHPMTEMGDDVLEASLQRPGDFEHGPQPTAYGPAMPPAKMFSCWPLVLITEQDHRRFFQGPGPCRLQPAPP